jgi:uncharacterized membrane protein
VSRVASVLNIRTLSIVALLAFVVWLSSPVLGKSGWPFGTDVHGHLARVWYMTEGIRTNGSIPEWLPHWYNGTPISQYYPPLSTLVMLPIQLATDNITTTYGIFVLMSLIGAAGFTYGLARRWGTAPWAALAAFIYVAAPFNVVSGRTRYPTSLMLSRAGHIVEGI